MVPEALRPPMGGADQYVYLHADGVLTVVDAAGMSSQRPLAAVRAAVEAAQSAGGTVWISGPDSAPGLVAVDRLLGDGPDPALLKTWDAPAPPVQWGVDGTGSGFLAAAEFGQHDVLDDLVERGTDLGWADPGGNTALHFAVHGGNHDGLERLLAAGADATAANADGITPLGSALLRGDAAAVRQLGRRDEHHFVVSHRLHRRVGFPLVLLCLAVAVAAVVAGVPAVAAALLAMAAVFVIIGRRWAPTPQTAEIVGIGDAGVTVQVSWRERRVIDPSDVPSAAYIGGTAGWRARVAVPSALGGPWSEGLGRRLGGAEPDISTVPRWGTDVVAITYDRNLRDEVLPALTVRLVLDGAELTPLLWDHVAEAVRFGGTRGRSI